ncbi:MAG: extracellular solute-binding protein [Chloroflexota bacterium]|nr:extracellular solute-binding protein [Chloroflexota bacterium]
MVGYVQGKSATRRGILLAGAATGASGILAAACASGGAGGEPAGLNALKGPVDVLLWDRHETGYDAFANHWVPMFNQKFNGKIKLTWESRTAEWETKMPTAVVAGTPPDLAAVFGVAFRNMQESKQLIALDTFIKSSSFDANDFVTGIYKSMNFGGNQVGLPQYINTNTVYYNKDTFKKLGVPFPTESWTQDQFLDMATKLSRGPSTAREVWGLDFPMDSITTRVISMVWGAGAQYNDPKTPDVFTINTQPNNRALQWAHDIFWKHRVAAKTNADRGGVDRNTGIFVNGNVAMMVEGTHLIGEWKSKAQADWDVAPLPKGPGGRGERLSMDGYIIPAGVKNQDASWVVMQEATGKEANKMRAEMLGYVPARKSQFESWTKSMPDKTLKNAQVSDEARVDPGSTWPKARDLTAAVNPIWRQLFVDNSINVSDALKQMQDAVVGVLGATAVKAG